jgi:1,6-anhydro-N-acetylmuramate kinase
MLRAMRVIGLMSGTSADGIDAALVEWPDDASARPFRLLAHVDTPFEPELQARIHRLAAGRVPAADALRELGALDVALGERFAEAAQGAAAVAGVPLASVTRTRMESPTTAPAMVCGTEPSAEIERTMGAAVSRQAAKRASARRQRGRKP